MNAPAFDWSVVISGIALIVAIISPVITTLLNNYHQDKMWEREHFSLHKSDVIEQYVKSTGTVLKEQATGALHEYGNCYGEIFFYAPEEAWPLIELIDAAIVSRNISADVNNMFVDLCKILSAEGKRPEK